MVRAYFNEMDAEMDVREMDAMEMDAKPC